jgi:hypothetical protein
MDLNRTVVKPELSLSLRGQVLVSEEDDRSLGNEDCELVLLIVSELKRGERESKEGRE